MNKNENEVNFLGNYDYVYIYREQTCLQRHEERL